MNTQQYKLIDAPVPVKTIKSAENRHLTAIEKKAIRSGMNQGLACFKSGRKIYTISHVDTNHYCVEIEERETTIFNRIETVSRKVPFSVRLEKTKDEVKEKSIEQIESEQLELMLTQEKSIETKEETQEVIDNPVETTKETEKEIDNPAVNVVKETKLQSKLNKYQTSLARLTAQLAVTKGNRNKAKIVLSMLEIESSIESLSLTIKNTQSFKDETVTLAQPEWLQKLSIPELTKERVVNTVNALDCKIEKLNNDINGITSQNHNNILTSNPAADTGGIRNQSDSKRQQFDDRLFRNAKNAVNASQERDTLITQKKRYIKDIKERPIFEKALKTGKKSSGESYDRETMQFIKDELKLINDRISKIEFSVTTQKFKKL